MEKSKVLDLIKKEDYRQNREICLIASENYVSNNIKKAVGSCLTNKYAEGYPSRRYYGGCEVVDEIEQYAIDKAKELFNCKWANVQPHSGSQANQAVYNALLKPGDTILSMSLDAGGHLTHGSKVSSSGQLYNIVHYGLDEDGYIDYGNIRSMLLTEKPRLIIVGASAYSRKINFNKIKQDVDYYNSLVHCSLNISGRDYLDVKEEYENAKCWFMVDMAHIAGIVAANTALHSPITGRVSSKDGSIIDPQYINTFHQSPLPYADVVTSTTHKTLRGPRGGLILSNNEELGKLIDKSVFPGVQGGPLMHVIAGKAICFEEALQPEFKDYIKQVIANCQAMAEVFEKNLIPMVSGGTDNHLLLLDLSRFKTTGKQVEKALEKIGIIVNKNAIYNDTRPRTETSGIRIGTAAITTKGYLESQCKKLAKEISEVIYKCSTVQDSELNSYLEKKMQEHRKIL